MEKKDNNKFLNIVAGLFLAGFSVYVIKELSSILIPFALAVIIAFIFEPFYIWMKSKKIPSGIAIAFIIILIVIIANIASVLIVASVNSFSSSFSVYETKFLAFVDSFISSMDLSYEDQQNLKETMKLSNLLKQGSITSFIAGFFTSFLGIFGDFVLILFYVIFILSEFGSIKERIKVAFSHERAENIVKTLDTIFIEVRRYMSGKTVISLALGILSGIVLWIFGVDFFFLWGFLIFIMHFIPNIGALIALSLPAVVMIFQFDVVTALIVTAILVILQNVIGNIVEPKVLGGKLNLSPLLLLMSLFFGAYIWGIVGMVLSVPIVSMLKIILANFESTKPIAILMSYKASTTAKKTITKTFVKKS